MGSFPPTGPRPGPFSPCPPLTQGEGGTARPSQGPLGSVLASTPRRCLRARAPPFRHRGARQRVSAPSAAASLMRLSSRRSNSRPGRLPGTLRHLRLTARHKAAVPAALRQGSVRSDK
ncbi:hypothetical protein NDU88_001020 [Pleurodeles waltl]|uniref:Uncharacterized protein n=1 Tax=Pleurodeles waltl TaxID=8319 RepID=A0AAV7R5Y8_PLEWA|nr:hypothetical protein NDU88_001020 [Pleurodeles waltl]